MYSKYHSGTIHQLNTHFVRISPAFNVNNILLMNRFRNGISLGRLIIITNII